jgi:2-keto-4-pentenoate hydratase/2-oxohepta-3-ene-1,7-dioic acid hydratase in catechol pathway
MKLTRFRTRARTGFGAWLDGGGIVDLGARMKDISDVRDLLTAGKLEIAAGLTAKHGADIDPDDYTFELPVDNPRKIICVGVNYPERHDEYKVGDYKTPVAKPSLFLRTTASFAAHGQPLLLPPESVEFDYEGEIALVIGKEGRRIPMQSAAGHIAGLTIANEGTVRDWLKHSNRQITPGKNFDQSGSLGPWIDTEAAKLPSLALKTFVNEELRQSDTTDRLVYSFAYLISYISTFSRLHPGDIILTGTPTGAGVRFDPPRFLKAGDVLRVDVSGVGSLQNPVVAEQSKPS